MLICEANGNYSIARLKLDPFSNLLYSTKAEGYTRITALTENGYSVSKAINELLKIESEQKKYI